MTNRTAYALMGAFGAVIVICVCVALASRCVGGINREADNRETERISGQHEPPSRKPIATDAGIDAPATRRELLARMRLPEHGIDATKIVGRTRAEVVAALGKGNVRPDKKTEYPIDGMNVGAIVTYQDERAVAVEIPWARARWATMDLAEQDAFMDWLGLPSHFTQINGRDVQLGDEAGGVGLAIYVLVYAQAVEKRVEDETNARLAKEAEIAARQKMRDDIVVGLRQLIRAMDGDFEIESDDANEILTFDMPPSDESCDRASLVKMAQSMKDFSLDPAKGFRAWRCSSGAELTFR